MPHNNSDLSVIFPLHGQRLRLSAQEASIWRPLFTKWTDVLPQDLAKSRSGEIGCYSDRIALKFYRHLGNAVADVQVKFMSHWKIPIRILRLRDLRLRDICGKTSIHLVMSCQVNQVVFFLHIKHNVCVYNVVPETFIKKTHFLWIYMYIRAFSRIRISWFETFTMNLMG